MTLTPTEARILAAIEYAAPEPIHIVDIGKYVYDNSYRPSTDDIILRQHIGRMRKKMPGKILTVRGVGYRVAV